MALLLPTKYLFVGSLGAAVFQSCPLLSSEFYVPILCVSNLTVSNLRQVPSFFFMFSLHDFDRFLIDLIVRRDKVEKIV